LSSSLSVMMQTEILCLSMRDRTSIEGQDEPVNQGSRRIFNCQLQNANCLYRQPLIGNWKLAIGNPKTY